MQIYPPPTKIRSGSRSFDRSTRPLLRIRGTLDPRVMHAATEFADWFGLAISHGGGDSERTLLTIDQGRTGSPESYRLQCNAEGISLRGRGAGLFYGLSTAAQILGQCEQWVPHFYIEDRPDFAHRGVMLDISRCKVPTLDTLLALIDRLASLKYNQLQLYTEHTYAFQKHPLVWADASPLTATDIATIQGHCQLRFIELVPNLNSFGHFERWLRHPEYHRFAECPQGFTHPLTGDHVEFGSTLKPNRNSLNLLKGLYDEYLPLFDSGHFNIGGDEPWELGQGWSRERCEAHSATRVYIDFLDEIRHLVDARDRTMMFWSDIVLKDPGCLKQLSRNAIAMNWGYEGNHPFRKECGQMAEARIPYYVCPGTSAWNSLTGRVDNATRNLDRAARAGLHNNAIGYLVTDWGDHGHHQYLPISYPGFLLGACHSWNHKGSRKLDLADGINRMFFDAADAGIGEILNRLGRALEVAPSPIRNATIFNRLLFWRMQHEPGATSHLDDDAIADADSELADIAGSLVAIHPAEHHGPVRDELDNAIRLARHGLHRLQWHRGSRQDLAALRTELAIGIGEHERLWLARNRPGGLHESSGRLRTSLDALRMP